MNQTTMRELKAVIENAQMLLREAMDSSAQGIAGVPVYLEDKLNAVRSDLHRARVAVERSAARTTRATEDYVQHNPWKSMGIVSAASVLFGVLLFAVLNSELGGSDRPGE